MTFIAIFFIAASAFAAFLFGIVVGYRSAMQEVREKLRRLPQECGE